MDVLAAVRTWAWVLMAASTLLYCLMFVTGRPLPTARWIHPGRAWSPAQLRVAALAWIAICAGGALEAGPVHLEPTTRFVTGTALLGLGVALLAGAWTRWPERPGSSSKLQGVSPAGQAGDSTVSR
jgi:hypothetical protein